MSMFHRGHYNKIGAVIGRRTARVDTIPEALALTNLATDLADMFAADNQEFDREMWNAHIMKHERETVETLRSDS